MDKETSETIDALLLVVENLTKLQVFTTASLKITDNNVTALQLRIIGEAVKQAPDPTAAEAIHAIEEIKLRIEVIKAKRGYEEAKRVT